MPFIAFFPVFFDQMLQLQIQLQLQLLYSTLLAESKTAGIRF